MRFTCLLFLISCAPNQPAVLDFGPYEDLFYKEASVERVNWDYILVDAGGSFWGRCHKAQGYIEVDKKVWERVSNTLREMLVFHELGHCALSRQHSDNKESLMQAPLMNPDYYKDHRAEVLEELFSE